MVVKKLLFAQTLVNLNNFCKINKNGLYIIPLQGRNELVGLLILFAGTGHLFL